MSFNCNDNLKKMHPHYNSLTPKGITRMHFNEVTDAILPVDVLFKDIDKNLNSYPEMEYMELEEISSKHYNVKITEITPTCGSDEGIDLCVRTYCNPGETILIPDPSFGSYAQTAGCFGVNVERFDLQNDGTKWFLDIDNFIKKAKEVKPKLIFLPNPLAQVGAIVKKDDVKKIIESLPDTMIVADEAYIEFDEENSVLSEFNKYENLTLLRTVSKFYGIPSIRLGFIISHFKDEFFKVKMPDNLNKLSCRIGCNLFENLTPAIISQQKEKIMNQKKQLIEFLKQFNEIETIYQSVSHFVYCKLNCKGADFAKKLLDNYNIKIRVFGDGKFENYCRVSVR